MTDINMGGNVSTEVSSAPTQGGKRPHVSDQENDVSELIGENKKRRIKPTDLWCDISITIGQTHWLQLS